MPTTISVSKELNQESIDRAAFVGTLPRGAHIHVSGACGTGMASVLTLLKTLGFYVTGSDRAFYPPMGELVRKTADKVYEGYSAGNLLERPALVVIGNSLSRNNPEVEYLLEHDLPFASMPEVFSGLLIGTREHCPTSIVVSGTHGKTTTTAAVATLFDHSGWKPAYFVGGVPKNLPGGMRTVDLSVPKERRVVVLEGDEYDSAFFAKYSKFHSYRPDIALITSLEFDHADIYESVEQIEVEFDRFVARVPKAGTILVFDSGERLKALVPKWRSDSKVAAPVKVYGEKHDSDFRLIRREPLGISGQRLEMQLEELAVSCHTSLSGSQNAWNLLAAAAIGKIKGLTADQIAAGIESFQGVLRRQDPLFDANGITLLEDFAHHPTAVDLTLKGLSEMYPGRRLIAVFEPRSNTSRRGFFQQEYAKAFSAADVVVILEVADAGGYSGTSAEIVPLDVAKLVHEISAADKVAVSKKTTDEITAYLKKEVRCGDVIVLMSNGDFGGLAASLPAVLAASN